LSVVTTSVRTAVAGETYLELRRLAPAWGMTIPTHTKDLVLLKSSWTTLQFVPQTRQLRLNGTLIWLNDTVSDVKGQWCINAVDRSRTIEPILAPSRHLAGMPGPPVLLDPGHGGEDVGAPSRTGDWEKDLTLALARRVRIHLANAGVRAVLTRDDDRTLSLETRVQMIRRTRAGVFVSLHFNTAPSPSVYGVETFALTPQGYSSTAGGDSPSRRSLWCSGNRFDAANVVLAYRIQRSLRLWLGNDHDRGVRRARFQVLRDATCPAVLVEAGFLSHTPTARRLASAEYVDVLAQRIAAGIVEYVHAVEAARTSSTAVPAKR
jgi:N-acetylmuramoyl-L-alanine amidase